jgi:hypothetical protein
MPRKLSRRTLRRREEQAIGGVQALSEVSPQAVIERYIAGEKIRKMATQYGVSDIALYAFLLRHVPEEWINAQRARAFAMKERGEDELERPTDPLYLSASREKIRAGQWDLERVMRKHYGRDEQNININFGDLGDRLRRARERIQVLERQGSSALSLEVAPAHEDEQLGNRSRVVALEPRQVPDIADSTPNP